VEPAAPASQDSTGAVWTIGHSDLSIERFLEALRAHDIELLVDVRTAPFSRTWPQFSRDTLARSAQADSIAYRFLGCVPGEKPDDTTLRRPHGLPDYDALAQRRCIKMGSSVSRTLPASSGPPSCAARTTRHSVTGSGWWRARSA